MLLRYACCVLFRLRCNEYSLRLSFYIFRIGRIENPFCSACRHLSQDTSHLILHCSATDSLRRSLFDNSLYDLWSWPWGVARLLGLHGLPPCLHPSERVGVTTPPPTTTNVEPSVAHLNCRNYLKIQMQRSRTKFRLHFDSCTTFI